MEKEYTLRILHAYKRMETRMPLTFIPILDENRETVGFLRPVTRDFRIEMPDCISLFSRWRKENPSLSPSYFQISDDRTERWLENLVVKNDNRVIFMVQSPSGKKIGHIGLANFRYEQGIAEIDSVLRGEKSCEPGMMRRAMAALIKWASETLEIAHFDLEVLSDNAHAISYYESCGFVSDGKIPLKKIVSEDEVRWEACDDLSSAEKYYTHMRFEKDRETNDGENEIY